MNRWIAVVVLLFPQSVFALALGGVTFLDFDETQRWARRLEALPRLDLSESDKAEYTARMGVRIMFVQAGLVVAFVLTGIQLAIVVFAALHVKSSFRHQRLLRRMPVVFLAAAGLGLIGLLTVPDGGSSPHNDIGRGLGFMLLMLVCLPAAGVSALQNWFLTREPPATDAM